MRPPERVNLAARRSVRHATLHPAMDSELRWQERRRAEARVPGAKPMNMMTKWTCCAMLAGATLLAPVSLKAQTDQDKQFLTMAAQGDQNEIALSKLAEQKAVNPQVKAFARKMVTDHTRLTAEMKPFAEKWGVTPPTGPDAEHQAELNKLNGLSGKEFDKEYIDQMVTDHDKALDAFTNEANDTKDAKFKQTVLKGKSVVASHKNMADSLQSKLK